MVDAQFLSSFLKVTFEAICFEVVFRSFVLMSLSRRLLTWRMSSSKSIVSLSLSKSSGSSSASESSESMSSFGDQC